jgi:AcrR family transcriptional regulator
MSVCDDRDATVQVDPSTRHRILREAAILFRTRGFASTTMRNIATAAGLTPGALYWHFPSKEAILYDILVALSDDWHAKLADVSQAPAPAEKLRRFVRAQINWELQLADEGHALLALYGPDQLKQFLTAPQRAFITGRQKEHFEVLESFLRDGIADGSFCPLDVTITAHAIYEMGAGVPRWWKLGEQPGVAALASMHEDLVMHMVSAKQSTDHCSTGEE